MRVNTSASSPPALLSESDIPARGRWWSTLARAEVVSQLGLLAGVVLTIAVFSILSPYYLTDRNVLNVGRAIATTGIVAAVTTMVLVCGELDLSIGAAMAVSGIVAAEMLTHQQPVALAIGVALASGAVMGLINALLIVIVGVNPLIATIGTQFAFRGLAFIGTSGLPVSTFDFKDFGAIGNGNVLGLNLNVIVFGLVLLTVGFGLSMTQLGSHMYAIGGSRAAARLAGVPVQRVRITVYLLSSVAAAMAGIILASANGSASPLTGEGIELTVISAVILGGTALTGGRGNVQGTLLGVLFLGLIANGMNLIGLAAYWQILIQGLALLVAIAVDTLFRVREQGGQ
jgi:ribose transport system permease protein